MSPRLPLHLAVWVVLALPGTAACKKKVPPPEAPALRPVLADVSIREVGTKRWLADSDLVDTGKRITSEAGKSGLFDARGDGGAGRPETRIRVEIALEPTEVGDKGVLRLGVRMRIATRPEEAAGALADDAEAALEHKFAAGPKLDRPVLFRDLADRTVRELFGSFVARTRLRDAPPAAVHAALAPDAGELREEAIRQVARRRLREEVPTLLGLLEDPDEAIRDAAMGALVELEEPRAVAVLTKTRAFSDRREMRKILDAVASIGGQEAADYLSFVADSHDDEEIRKMAASAKARLERRIRRDR